MNPAGHEHGNIAANLTMLLAQHVKSHKLGRVYAAETGFKLSEKTVIAPDTSYVSNEKLKSILKRSGFFPGAPDLAAEVVSPSDPWSEVEEKTKKWLDAGTSVVIIIDPRRKTVTCYRSVTDITTLDDDAQLDLNDVVSGFRVDVKEIFE